MCCRAGLGQGGDLVRELAGSLRTAGSGVPVLEKRGGGAVGRERESRATGRGQQRAGWGTERLRECEVPENPEVLAPPSSLRP